MVNSPESVTRLDSLRLEVLADCLTLPDRTASEHAANASNEHIYDERHLAQRLLHRHPKLGDRVATEIAGEALEQWKDPLDGLDHLAHQLIELRNGYFHLRSHLDLRLPRSLLDEDLLAAGRCAGYPRRAALYSPPRAQPLVRDPLPAAVDRDLEELLESPVAETHLHLGGAAPPFTFWLPLVLGLYSAEIAANMAARATLFENHAESRSERELTDLWLERLLEACFLRWRIAARLPEATGDGRHPFRHVQGFRETHGRRRKFFPALESRGLMGWLVGFREALEHLGQKSPPHPRSPPLPGCPIWVHPGGEFPYRDPLTQAVEIDLGFSCPCEAAALGERYLLASALRCAGGAGSKPASRSLKADLLRYVRIKNAVMRLLVHYPGVHGLDRFRNRFGRFKKSKRGFDDQRRHAVWRYATIRYMVRSTVMRWIATGTRQSLVGEGSTRGRSADLAKNILGSAARRLERRLEMRRSPGRGPDHSRALFAVAQGLRDALRALARTGDNLGARREILPALQAGVVLHLQKRAGWEAGRYEEISHGALLWLDDHPAWRPLILGIDAAGSELDGPPSRFRSAYAEVGHFRANGARRQSSIPVNLGKTFHVGEDFRDLLTGVRQVDLAIRLLDLRAADRLGHALAVGHEPETWYRRHDPSLPLRGDHALDLLWAWDRLKATGQNEAESLKEIERRWLALEGGSIGEKARLVREWIESPERKPVESEEDLQRKILDGEKARMLVDVPHDRAWLRTVKRLQEIVLETIDRRGLFIETNPTSNFLIGGLEDFAELPLFRWHPVRPNRDERPPLRISVSTDDPTTFRVNLREEYDALFQAAMSSGRYGRREILEWLGRLRADSFSSSFLSRSSPSGEDLLRWLELIAPDEPSRTWSQEKI